MVDASASGSGKDRGGNELSRALPRGSLLAIEPKGQTLGTSAGLDKFGQAQRSHSVTALFQGSGQFRCPFVQDHGPAHYNRVATERDRLLGRNLDQPLNTSAQDRTTVIVERPRVIDRFVLGQRAEAGIEMIEARVDQLQGQYLNPQVRADPEMTAGIAPETIAREERLATKKRVAGPLEMIRGRKLLQAKTMGTEPSLEMRRLTLAHPVPEPRADESGAVNKPRIGGEYQVRKPRDRLHPFDRHTQLK